MTRVAAIDCGTNSIRLLVSDIHGDEKSDVLRRMKVVRLGQGVDRHGRLASEAIDRTLAACREYAEDLATLGAERIAFYATSAARDAENGAEFCAAVQSVLGVRPRIVTGPDEARLSFLGAARELPSVPTLVVDIGGGSTELVVGQGEEVRSGRSLDLGSVRMTERFLGSDPPAADEVAACAAHLDAALTPVLDTLPAHEVVVGVAGTITTVAAHVLHLPEYSHDAIHHARLAVAEVRQACRSLIAMSVAERLALPFMHPGRADVIGGGALILERILAHVGERDFVVSEQDILDGIAWETARAELG
jgi:exopolyphosphatase/guanosine-5'-triphosphate,3'-diphosphate pyrophosphatase